MKAGWQIKNLGDLCDILDNQRKPITKSDRAPGPIPYYGSTGIQDYVEGYLFDEPLVLVGEDGAKWASGENTAFAVNGKCWVNNHAHVLRPHRSKLMDNWLIHFLVHSDLSGFVSGLTVPKLNQGSLREIAIPLPPLPEQHRIVAILDEAFENIAAAKANAEQNLKNARALFESHLQAVFTQRGEGWVEKRLKDVCEKITDGTHQTPKYFDQGYIFLSSKNVNVNEGVIDWDNVKYIDEKQHVEMQRRLAPRINDILLRKNGAGYGKAALVDRDIIFDVYVSLAVLRPLKFISPKYLLHFINSAIAMKQFNARIKGAGVPNLHLEEIREVVVSFPKTFDEQEVLFKKIEALQEETHRLESIYKQKIAALDELKKALLHKAFAGEL